MFGFNIHFDHRYIRLLRHGSNVGHVSKNTFKYNIKRCHNVIYNGVCRRNGGDLYSLVLFAVCSSCKAITAPLTPTTRHSQPLVPGV